MSLEETLYDRIPVGTAEGRSRVIRYPLAASTALRGLINDAGKDRSATPYGRAVNVLAPHLKKEALPALVKARRQSAYTRSELEKQRAALRAKAIGEPLPTDHLWIQKVWQITNPNERRAYILRTPVARGPMLRNPELTDLSPDIFKLILEQTIGEMFAGEAEKISKAEELQKITDFAVAALEKTILETPVVTDRSGHWGKDLSGPIVHPPGTGEVRAFQSKRELDSYLKTEIPNLTDTPTPFERAEADFVEAA